MELENSLPALESLDVFWEEIKPFPLAVSRARALAVLVASAKLLEVS